jgi:hypothetical protein
MINILTRNTLFDIDAYYDSDSLLKGGVADSDPLFLGLLDPDPDPSIRGMDPDQDPDRSIIKPK